MSKLYSLNQASRKVGINPHVLIGILAQQHGSFLQWYNEGRVMFSEGNIKEIKAWKKERGL